MALILIEGFDHYSNSGLAALKGWSSPAGVSAYVPGRLTGQAVQISSSDAELERFLPASYTTLIVGFAYQMSGFPNDQIFRIESGVGNTVVAHISALASGHIAVTNAGGTTIATGSAVLVNGAFFYLEFKIVINGAAGSVTSQVNGVADIPTTTGDFGTAPATHLRIINVAPLITAQYDDVYVCDTTGTANNDFLGDVHVETLYPASDGTYSQWTPSAAGAHFSLVNEHSVAPFPDEDLTYVASSTVGQKDSYRYDSLSVLSGQIFGLQTNLWARKDDAATRVIEPLIRRSGADYTSTNLVLATSYVDGTAIWENDPSTANPWTVGGVNNAEYGVEVVT